MVRRNARSEGGKYNNADKVGARQEGKQPDKNGSCNNNVVTRRAGPDDDERGRHQR